ncbi:hypothetical protein HanRHA438_Chr14g0644171 [Helianthus annuus]|nr:hypothetical protein HanRHA438_Chr14g0644171 [Helianthus annuus]
MHPTLKTLDITLNILTNYLHLPSKLHYPPPMLVIGYGWPGYGWPTKITTIFLNLT